MFGAKCESIDGLENMGSQYGVEDDRSRKVTSNRIEELGR